ncbi:putative Diguanylate cyclase [Deinococcus phoenicis]|uniref:Putative Diguanylate cyclase n=1 Tax=Deinococcus phoenicis TaxID=1476583 RepID=A0A016QUP4_9DEIO|nr:putative Diguanylate cyclase [Deinococcus phoenicis]
MPLLAAVTAMILLIGLRVAAPVYLALVAAFVVFDLLALFGPARWRPALLARAPGVYALLLLTVWVCALYALPTHPATRMTLLTVVLHTTTLYVFFFVQRPPGVATRRACLTLGAFVVTALPHSWKSLGWQGAFDGVTLPITLLCSHGVLILVLRSFSQARDQLAQEQARARALHELAHRDPLTELYNRRALERDLALAVQNEPSGQLLALIDIDGLKQVNDTLGHAAGDDLLRRFAVGFAQTVKPGGRAYRLSGDEFALLLEGAGPDLAAQVVRDVTREVREVYPLAGASVGAACRRSGETPGAWLSRADQAMYGHKKRLSPPTASSRR